MVAISQPSPHFIDPTWFAKSLVGSDVLTVKGFETTRLSSAAEFWTGGIAARGVADDTNWTADTYKTIANISGKGLIYNIIGPTGLAGTPTTTVRITRDGLVTTIAEAASATAQRLLLGPAFPGAVTGTQFTVAGVFFNSLETMNAGKTAQIGATAYTWLMDILHMSSLGSPGLQFSQSCLIEMKSSESNSTTTNRERSSGIIYRKFA